MLDLPFEPKHRCKVHRAHAELASPLAPRLPRSDHQHSHLRSVRAERLPCAHDPRALRRPPWSAQGRRRRARPRAPRTGLEFEAALRAGASSAAVPVGGTWPLRSNRRHGQPIHRDPLVAASPRGARGHAATLMGRPAACASPRSACDALRARMAILCARSSPGAADECVPRRALAARGAFCLSRARVGSCRPALHQIGSYWSQGVCGPPLNARELSMAPCIACCSCVCGLLMHL